MGGMIACEGLFAGKPPSFISSEGMGQKHAFIKEPGTVPEMPFYSNLKQHFFCYY